MDVVTLLLHAAAALPLVFGAIVVAALPFGFTPWAARFEDWLAARTMVEYDAWVGWTIIAGVLCWWLGLAIAAPVFGAPIGWVYYLAFGMTVYGVVMGAALPKVRHGPGDATIDILAFVLPTVIGLVAVVLIWLVDWAVACFGG
ncbi:MAG: hypothetical protein RIB45_17790 [Marivibrio sp.]|uniref:hypothetical protein n=1 Tax=Marivibrio sp. TaxID=2039719 RepID=UPI0032EEDAEB